MLKWSASLTMLFKEVPFLERFQAAAEAGFGAVEFMWPSGEDLDALLAAREASGVEVALFNVDSGDVPAGERGFPNLPDRRAWWRERMGVAIELAGRLGATRINVQAGNEAAGLSHSAMLDCLCDNLDWALQQAPGISFFLEALNRVEHPRYILGTNAQVLEVLERIHHPRLKLLLDMYHTQRSEGNLSKFVQAQIAHIGHIQVADSPDRHQPGTGEINWRYVFEQLEALEYRGFIGLEYIPIPDTPGSLSWLPLEKRRGCTSGDLSL